MSADLPVPLAEYSDTPAFATLPHPSGRSTWDDGKDSVSMRPVLRYYSAAIEATIEAILNRIGDAAGCQSVSAAAWNFQTTGATLTRNFFVMKRSP